ncbi:hypothetical protein ACFFJY_14395 [Fictibacillus aquaticus]|uniref:DUF5673 domain-containing protein n=1 Tax=Fictibacillus aquaticus TaxID=2021314 RepID=A0A235FDH3_9BACL|nr:hypothetical protein [Fictibacillus aquaticus]OYD59406.1 hypothetical protein CGZ90_05820 [Fictibacillus aquaticus]
MVYTAKTERVPLVFLLTIIIASIFMGDISGWLFYFQLAIAMFIFAALFIRFKLEIAVQGLTYEILFITLPIHKKIVYPNEIIKLVFKRYGWTTKGARIQLKKGFNIRIVNFVPENIFSDLNDFANQHMIPISIAKDYQILDR